MTDPNLLDEQLAETLEAMLSDKAMFSDFQDVPVSEAKAKLTALIKSREAAARVDTAQAALKACPTNNAKLRLWLERSIAILAAEEEGE